MTSARPVTAASGSPPASDFAVTTRSGTTPSCSIAKTAPVRPSPDWISSATKTIPFAAANDASAGTNPLPGTTNPPSPWIGSITMHAIRSAPICFCIRWMASAAHRGPHLSGASPVGHRYGYDIGIR